MAGEYFVPGNRGRGTLSPTGQVAEIAVARQLSQAGKPVRYGQFDVEDDAVVAIAGVATVGVTDIDTGDNYTVVLSARTVDGVISSCGAEPKQADVWEVESVTQIN